jgi:hypothetical protein
VPFVPSASGPLCRMKKSPACAGLWVVERQSVGDERLGK